VPPRIDPVVRGRGEPAGDHRRTVAGPGQRTPACGDRDVLERARPGASTGTRAVAARGRGGRCTERAGWPPETVATKIALEALTKSYLGMLPVLDNVSCKIEEGEFY